MPVRERLQELARITAAPTPVVSVYLGTRWGDEHQRERVRVFLKTAVQRARVGAGPDLRDDLDWIEAQGARLVAQAELPDAHGVALFACRGVGLREAVPLRTPFEEAFFVEDHPVLTPLAAWMRRAPSTLVVFVDGASARLIPVDPRGRGPEVVLEHAMEGRHRHGGWALLAQSRYRRHIEAHRGQHFEAVTAALDQLADRKHVERIVMAGPARALAAFRQHLPPALAARVVGVVPGTRHEPAAVLVGRALQLLAALDRGAPMDAVLTEAAKGGRGAAGLADTLEAVRRGSVRRLYLLRGFAAAGRGCSSCGTLQADNVSACRTCGAPTKSVELSEVLVDRVLASGGEVEVLDEHPGLARAGGIAAHLRYRL